MLEVPSWVGMLFCYRDGGKITSVCVVSLCSHFQPTPGMHSCYRCPVGKWESGWEAQKCSGTCDKCDTGRFGTMDDPGMKEGSTCRCEDCPAGKFTAAGHSKCHDCPPGRYIGEPGLGYCHYCLPGHYSLAGQTECKACYFEKYQPEKGQMSCIQCPKGRYQHRMRQVECTGTSHGHRKRAWPTNHLAPNRCGRAQGAAGSEVEPPGAAQARPARRPHSYGQARRILVPQRRCRSFVLRVTAGKRRSQIFRSHGAGGRGAAV